MPTTLLTENDVADLLKVSLACLRRWRLECRGPVFIKVGSLVRYPAEELEAWLRTLPRKGPSGSPPTSSKPVQRTA
ncbi:MAG: helix-turn-helix domain-containing protein [Acidobacteria bacterium]|nr:helix-turn-helix domain-containing protein [Acidobacteriota bacterium]